MTDQLSPASVACPADPVLGRRATVVATVHSRAGATAAALNGLPTGVTGVEIRADLTGDLSPDQLRRHGCGQLTYSLRSRRYGGHSAEAPVTRRTRLLAAARGYDLVDLEADHDLVPEVLAGIPAQQRRICWYGGETDLAGLRTRFERMARVPAALYLLAPRAGSFPAALTPLRLLASLGRNDVTAFGTGPVAAFSRVLAPWLGAPVVYGSPAGPTTDQLLTDYPFPELAPLASIGGIVGRSLHTSLFLRLINAAFQELSVPSLFLPFVVPGMDEFRDRFWPAVTSGFLDELGLPLHALTVAAPYKPAAFAAATLADPQARAAQAANLLLRQPAGRQPGDRWQAATTDGSAVLAALLDTGPVVGVPAAVIGCGDAGRAAASALSGAGARVTLVNRSTARGRFAASRLGLPFVPLSAFDPGRYAVLVHATPLDNRLPFPLDNVPAGAIVADFVCAAATTALVAAARSRGLTTVDGRQVLAQEVKQQFMLMTGRRVPASVCSR
jgi:3-dehydroquinate dehydratase/shikimate dehydrogenase